MVLAGFLFCKFLEYLEAGTIFSTRILWEGVPQLNNAVRKYLLLVFVFVSVICCSSSVLNSVLLPKQGHCGPCSQHHLQFCCPLLCWRGIQLVLFQADGFRCSILFVLWQPLTPVIIPRNFHCFWGKGSMFHTLFRMLELCFCTVT